MFFYFVKKTNQFLWNLNNLYGFFCYVIKDSFGHLKSITQGKEEKQKISFKIIENGQSPKSQKINQKFLFGIFH
jgi:hypothetical protein